jgi:hypothetical protein
MILETRKEVLKELKPAKIKFWNQHGENFKPEQSIKLPIESVTNLRATEIQPHLYGLSA